MALIVADRVQETTTTTGTGNVTLLGAASGYQAFSAVCANGDECVYCIADQSGTNWEVGLGTYVSATPALARTTVLASSNSGSLVSFTSGTKNVFLTDAAEQFKLPERTTDPTAPVSGAVMYTRPLGGRIVPRFLGPSGLDSAVQPAWFANNVTMWLPGTGTTAAINLGVSWTVGATQAHPTIVDTNVMTRMKRATYTTTTTSGNAAGVRSAAPVATRTQGFFFVARFGVLTFQAQMQIMVGMASGGAALAGEPSALANTAYVGKDSTDTDWQAVTHDGSTANKTSTGTAVAAGGASGVIDAYIFCKPGDSQIGFCVVDIATDTVLLADTVVTANLPVTTVVLYMTAQFRAGSAGAVAGFLNKMYMESDI